MKAITVRVPDDVWHACHKRLADDIESWQNLLLPVVESYARGEKIEAYVGDAPLATELYSELVRQYGVDSVTNVLQSLLEMLGAKKNPRR
jgi:hypothetical protein